MANLDTVGVRYDADIKQLQAQLDRIIADNAKIQGQVDEIGKEYSQTSTKAAAGLKSVDTQTKQVAKNTSQMQGVINKAGAAMVAAFATSTIIAFGKKILEVSANFQRMEAVLTNTLGSKGAAQAAMTEIVEFATKTPFQVQELTDSFVKLANQGFIPTQDEMRKLGDLAASQGKSFDMLTEAIIDAQTGEFERLKEFGIRASKEGDKVTFSFKGVETQTKFTADAMRDYILSLGDVEGVSGGMAAISETLGGKFSNMEDAVMALHKSLGDELNPVMMDLISGVIEVIDNLDVLAGPLQEVGSLFGELFTSIAELTGELFSVNAEGVGVKEVMEGLAVSTRVAQIPIKTLVGVLTLLADTWRLMINEAKKAANFLGAEFEIDELLTTDRIVEDAKRIVETFDVVKEEGYDFQKQIDDFNKKAELDGARKKKKDEADARNREKDRQKDIKDAEKQAAIMLKMQFQIQEQRIALMDEGLGKELAKRQLAFVKEQEQLKGNKTAMLLAEKKYWQDVEKIRQENELKEIETTREVGKAVVAEREKQVEGEFALIQEGFKKIEEKRVEEKDNLTKLIEEGLVQVRRNEEEKRSEVALTAEGRVQVEEASFAAINSLGEIFIKDQERLAQFQKTMALFQLGLDTARAISAGIAASAGVPFPGNLIAIVTTVATVLANIAQAKSLLSTATPPAFKEGVIDLQGPGTETSDSIPARLSRRESVMTAGETKAWKDELMAIRTGRFEDFIFDKYVLPALREDRKQRDTASNMAHSINLQNMFDDSRIVSAVRENKPATSKDIKGLGRDLQKTFKDSAYRAGKMWKN